MFKRIFLFLAVITAAIVLTGCPAVLTTNLPSDLMITLGLFRPADNPDDQLRAAVGGEISVPVLISDQNNPAASGDYEVTFTLSTDADLSSTGDNIAVSTETVTAGAESIVALAVPAAAAAATYNLFASFEAAAEDPAVEIGDTRLNLAYVQVEIDAENAADLVIEFVDPPSAYRPPGTEFPLSFKITNNGFKKVDSGTAIVVGFQIPINGTDTNFGEATVTLASDLYPYDFVTGTATITVPSLAQIAADDVVAEAEVDAWSGTLTGTVDTGDSVTETAGNEGGTDTFTVSSGTAKPELRVSDLDIPAYSVAGGTVEVSVVVSNSGYAAAAAGAYGVVLFHDVNTDGTYDVGTDTVLHTWEAASNPAVPWDPDGSGHDEVVFNALEVENLVYPASMAAGDHRIGAIITGDFDEWDSTNNTRTEDLHLAASEVDLEIINISTTNTSVLSTGVDETVPITLTIENTGRETLTTDFTIEFFLDDDGTLDTSVDISLGTTTVTDDMVPGGSGRVVVSYDATVNTATAGYYTVYALLDSTDAVGEMDDSNNQPTNAATSPVYLLISDGTTPINARLMLYYPDGASNNSSYYQYYYFWNDTSAWTTGNFDSDGSEYMWSFFTGPRAIDYIAATLTPGNTHGIRTYANGSPTMLAWRFVPDYVNSIDTQYIPDVLSSDDAYEDNDAIGSPYDLSSGTVNPLYQWINSYDSSSNDDDYYTFDL